MNPNPHPLLHGQPTLLILLLHGTPPETSIPCRTRGFPPACPVRGLPNGRHDLRVKKNNVLESKPEASLGSVHACRTCAHTRRAAVPHIGATRRIRLPNVTFNNNNCNWLSLKQFLTDRSSHQPDYFNKISDELYSELS